MTRKTQTYQPNELAVPTPEELKNGWDAERLTSYLRDTTGTQVEFRRELLERAHHRAHLAGAAVDKFRRTEDLTSDEAQEQLAELERVWREAAADAAYAADQLAAVEAAA